MKRIVLLLPLLLLMVGCGTTTTISYPTSTASSTALVRCMTARGLPDAHCTPGAVFSGVSSQKICVAGYTTSVRNVPASEKAQVFAEYGIIAHTPGQYEVDHSIPLELAGSNDIANLWPEAAVPKPGFHEKDSLENFLHAQVCKGTLLLSCAQRAIATNWLAAYNEMMQQKPITC